MDEPLNIPFCGECNFFVNECTDGDGWCEMQDRAKWCDMQCDIEHTELTNAETAKGLSAYNKWRRGSKGDMPRPYVIGKIIDSAIHKLRNK